MVWSNPFQEIDQVEEGVILDVGQGSTESAQQAKGLRVPNLSTDNERALHSMTHLPFRSGCLMSQSQVQIRSTSTTEAQVTSDSS